jgi:hypothetical protein
MGVTSGRANIMTVMTVMDNLYPQGMSRHDAELLRQALDQAQVIITAINQVLHDQADRG